MLKCSAKVIEWQLMTLVTNCTQNFTTMSASIGKTSGIFVWTLSGLSIKIRVCMLYFKYTKTKSHNFNRILTLLNLELTTYAITLVQNMNAQSITQKANYHSKCFQELHLHVFVAVFAAYSFLQLTQTICKSNTTNSQIRIWAKKTTYEVQLCHFLSRKRVKVGLKLSHRVHVLFYLWRTVHKIVRPELVLMILNELDECNQQSPRMRSVYNKSFQQHSDEKDEECLGNQHNKTYGHACLKDAILLVTWIGRAWVVYDMRTSRYIVHERKCNSPRDLFLNSFCICLSKKIKQNTTKVMSVAVWIT